VVNNVKPILYFLTVTEIAKTSRSDIGIRNFLKTYYMKFRTSNVCAIKFRKNDQTSFQKKKGRKPNK
jgi:hypothetical protein